MAFGLLIEGLIGYRIPALMDDAVRREMFRLAHAHGTLLNLVLLAAVIGARLEMVKLEGATAKALALGVLLMPLGFLLGGVWHYKGDPGLGIFLVPAGAILLIWSSVRLALSAR